MQQRWIKRAIYVKHFNLHNLQSTGDLSRCASCRHHMASSSWLSVLFLKWQQDFNVACVDQQSIAADSLKGLPMSVVFFKFLWKTTFVCLRVTFQGDVSWRLSVPHSQRAQLRHFDSDGGGWCQSHEQQLEGKVCSASPAAKQTQHSSLIHRWSPLTTSRGQRLWLRLW